MIEAPEKVLETLEICSELTRLITQEDFIISSHHKTFKSLQTKQIVCDFCWCEGERRDRSELIYMISFKAVTLQLSPNLYVVILSASRKRRPLLCEWYCW
jgi:hypothetical protein